MMTCRFLLACRVFPLLIFWLVASPYDVVDENRKACARDLLTRTDAEISDETILKLRIIFRLALEETATSGTISKYLWMPYMMGPT